jgi:hypothetical protein
MNDRKSSKSPKHERIFIAFFSFRNPKRYKEIKEKEKREGKGNLQGTSIISRSSDATTRDQGHVNIAKPSLGEGNGSRFIWTMDLGHDDHFSQTIRYNGFYIPNSDS